MLAVLTRHRATNMLDATGLDDLAWPEGHHHAKTDPNSPPNSREGQFLPNNGKTEAGKLWPSVFNPGMGPHEQHWSMELSRFTIARPHLKNQSAGTSHWSCEVQTHDCMCPLAPLGDFSIC